MKIRNRRLAGFGLVAASAAMGAVALAPVAEAVGTPPPLTVSTADQFVKVSCRFTVTSVNYAAGTLRGRMTLNAKPGTYAGGKQVKTLQSTCLLKDGDGTWLHLTWKDTNGPYAYKSEIVTLSSIAASYDLCAFGYWHLKDNATSGGPGSCTA